MVLVDGKKGVDTIYMQPRLQVLMPNSSAEGACTSSCFRLVGFGGMERPAAGLAGVKIAIVILWFHFQP